MQGFGLGDEDRAELTMIEFPFFPFFQRSDQAKRKFRVRVFLPLAFILMRGRPYELEVNHLIFFFFFYEVDNLIFLFFNSNLEYRLGSFDIICPIITFIP